MRIKVYRHSDLFFRSRFITPTHRDPMDISKSDIVITKDSNGRFHILKHRYGNPKDNASFGWLMGELWKEFNRESAFH